MEKGVSPLKEIQAAFDQNLFKSTDSQYERNMILRKLLYSMVTSFPSTYDGGPDNIAVGFPGHGSEPPRPPPM